MSGLFIKRDDTISVKIYLAQNQKDETIFDTKKDELVKKKFNYQNYRKPRRQRNDQRKIRRPIQGKQN